MKPPSTPACEQGRPDKVEGVRRVNTSGGAGREHLAAIKNKEIYDLLYR